MTPTTTHTLNDQTSLPGIGLGTFGLNGPDGVDSVVSALELGYGLLDTAAGYFNQEVIGAGIRRSGVDRSDIVVTSKVPSDHHGAVKTRDSFHRTLASLGIEQLDLYLIHWPKPELGLFVETWETIVDLREQGLIRSIGVSNFDADQLDQLIRATGVVPAVNQIEVHPFKPQLEMRQVNAELGILTESWKPLGPPEQMRSHKTIAEIASNYGVAANQVVLRWHIQLGALPIPMSRSTDHQRDNFTIFNFELSEDEMQRITAIASPADAA